MTLGTDDVQAACGQYRIVAHLPVGFDFFNLLRRWIFQRRDFRLPATAEHNIGTTARHVGSDGHRGRIACLSDDIRFAGMELGVQNVVLNAGFGQLTGNHFRFFDRDCPHQHRLTGCGTGFDIFDNRLNFFRFGHIDQIRHVFTDHRTVGRHDHGIQLIDRAEFKGFSIGGTGHPRQFLIQTEIVLEGDRGQSLVLVLDLHALFGLNGLVQTIGPAPALHCTTSVLIDDDNFAIFNNVVNVAGEQRMGAQRGGDVVHQHNIGRGVQGLTFIHNAFLYQQLFNQHQTTFGQVNLTRFFIHREVAFAGEGVRIFFFLTDQVRNDLVDLTVHFRAVFRRAGNDQRRTRLIDQDGVHLIHQRIVQFTLNALFRAEGHVVAQVVEAVFVVGAIGDIGSVGFTLRRRRQAGHVDANRHAQEFKQRAVIFGVTLRQIVVDGHHVNAFAGQRIEVGRQGRGQGFTFTGTHLGDAAIVKHHTAQQLDVEVAHAEYALTGFANDGESFRDQAFQRFAFFQARAEFSGFRFQLVIREFFHRRFHAVDDIDDFAHTTQRTVVTAAENLG